MNFEAVEAERWMSFIRKEEARVLAQLHHDLIQKMKQEAGAWMRHIEELPDPETREQEDILEDEGTYRLEFPDGSALVLGEEVNGLHITYGFHRSRIGEDSYQGFRHVEEDNELNGMQRPAPTVN